MAGPVWLFKERTSHVAFLICQVKGMRTLLKTAIMQEKPGFQKRVAPKTKSSPALRSPPTPQTLRLTQPQAAALQEIVIMIMIMIMIMMMIIVIIVIIISIIN